VADSKRVLVVLSGCGVFDGTEIHEAVITLLALSNAGATWDFAAPNRALRHVINHQEGNEAGESRNVLVESARIARGPVQDAKSVTHNEYDALFFPGGFGAAKNLSTVAFDGPDCTIDPDVERIICDFHGAGKPIGAVCIAPTLLVRALGTGTVTIGSDEGTAQAIETMGGKHVVCDVKDTVVDSENRLVTAPAYMCDAQLCDIATGIDKAVQDTLSMA